MRFTADLPYPLVTLPYVIFHLYARVIVLCTTALQLASYALALTSH